MPDNLAEIRSRLEAARVLAPNGIYPEVVAASETPTCMVRVVTDDGEYDPICALIHHAPADIAYLLALLDSLREHLPRLVAACRTTESYYESVPGFRGTVRTTAAARAALEAIQEKL